MREGTGPRDEAVPLETALAEYEVANGSPIRVGQPLGGLGGHGGGALGGEAITQVVKRSVVERRQMASCPVVVKAGMVA